MELFPTRARDSCPLCGGHDLAPEFFSYDFQGASLPAAHCRDCRFIFLSRQPTREGFARLYDAQYFDSDYHCGCSERPYFESEAEQRAVAHGLLGRLERELPPGRILEVGCAGGFFLAAARDRGWTPVGVEISDEAARASRESLGLDVRTGTLEEAGLETGSFDAVFLGDTLEHVPEPMTTLGQVRTLLRSRGAALVAVPVTLHSLEWQLRAPLYRLRPRPRVMRLPPYHLVEFTPATLGRALRDSGFDVSWIRQSKIAPDWANRRHRPFAVHAVKMLFDAANWSLTGLTGRFGDRALALGRRRE